MTLAIMGSHSVTCYPTQVNTPRLNPSHAGRYSIYLSRRDGRLSWPISWLDRARPGVEQATFRSRFQRPTNATTKTTVGQKCHGVIPGCVRWLSSWKFLQGTAGGTYKTRCGGLSLSTRVCFKFPMACFCHELAKWYNTWQRYHTDKKKGWRLFSETQCIILQLAHK